MSNRILFLLSLVFIGMGCAKTSDTSKPDQSTPPTPAPNSSPTTASKSSPSAAQSIEGKWVAEKELHNSFSFAFSLQISKDFSVFETVCTNLIFKKSAKVVAKVTTTAHSN